jgi:hypothetical protein
MMGKERLKGSGFRVQKGRRWGGWVNLEFEGWAWESGSMVRLPGSGPGFERLSPEP